MYSSKKHQKKEKHHKQTHKSALDPAKNTAPPSSDYYSLLGVAKTASATELKKAYFKLAKECHPDHHMNDPHAEARFKAISEAYSVLSDARKRAQYDRYGKEGIEANEMGMSDIIRHLFGEGAFDDVFGDLSIEFEEDEEEEALKLLKKEIHEYRLKIRELRKGNDWEALEVELKKFEDACNRGEAMEERIDERKEATKKKVRELCDQLAAKLTTSLSTFEPTSQSRFESEIQNVVRELLDSPGGLGLVQAVGDGYSREARRYFDDGSYPFGISRLVAWGSAIKGKIGMTMDVLSKTRKVQKMIREREGRKEGEKSGENLTKEGEAELLNEGMQTIWLIGKMMVDRRIVRICQVVLGDKGITDNERERRSRAVLRMSEIFIAEAAEREKDLKPNDHEIHWQQQSSKK